MSLTMKLIFIYIGIIMINNIQAQNKFTNDLTNEESPYLQQHSSNPVNWKAWSQSLIQKAKKENKLIFLSIGYSTCHWCHVMEEESFENEEVAKILNKNYISIKVDREEMPHLDKYYQDIHNILNNRSGGWPLNIILTPSNKAFFAATYIPLDDKYGRIGIKNLLKKIQSIYEEDPKKVIQSANEIEKVLKNTNNKQSAKVNLKNNLIEKFVKNLEENYDEENHGIGMQPKFPHASSIITLLDIYNISKNQKAFSMANKMLKAMARGGIYDQIEGGFYRYSVDEEWMIPHFEKMLYTNAELLSAYSKAYLLNKDDFYKNIVDEIISFVNIRFNNDFLLSSASDADSLLHGKQEEGAYFVFDYKQTLKYLEELNYSKKEIENIFEYFNIREDGNFENNLNNPYISDNITLNNLKKIKNDLKQLRSSKVYPFIDEKILTSWNAMYISSLFEAGKIRDKYNTKALKHLDTLVKNLYINDVLYHQKFKKNIPKVKALFEDYSFLITALLKAYDYSLNKTYLSLANKLNDELIKKFHKNEQWYMSDDEFQVNVSIYDSAYKSSFANALDNFLKLASLNDDLKLQNLVKNTLENNSLSLTQNTTSSPWLLRTYLAYTQEYIILKAEKDMLLDKTIPNYSFLLKKEYKAEQYLACKIGICFAYTKDFDEIILKINKEVKGNK